MTGQIKLSAAAAFLSLLYLFNLSTTVHGQCLTDNDAAQPVTKAARNNLYLGEQAFTLSLLRAINSTASSENIFFSPYSTYQALLLAYFGAKGHTEQELAQVLNLQWANNKFDVMQAYRVGETLRNRRAANSSVVFRAADKIFLSKETKLRCVNVV